MKGKSNRKFQSKLLGKVARGAYFPVLGINSPTDTDMFVDGAGDFFHSVVSSEQNSIEETGGAGDSPGFVSPEEMPGGNTALLEDNLGPVLPETIQGGPQPGGESTHVTGSGPVADHLDTDTNEISYRSLADNKRKDVSQDTSCPAENKIKDNTPLVVDEENTLNEFAASLPANSVYEKTVPEDSTQGMKETASKKVAYHDRQMGPEESFHLNAGDFQAKEKQLPPPALTPIFSVSDGRNRGGEGEGRKGGNRLVKESGLNINIKSQSPIEDQSLTVKSETNKQQSITPKKTGTDEGKSGVGLTAGMGLQQDVGVGFNKKTDFHSGNHDAASHKKVMVKQHRRQLQQDRNIIKRPVWKDSSFVDKQGVAALEKTSHPRKGSLKVGRINIHVKGPEKAVEEVWPEAPEYSDHILTQEWEWSCLYRK